MIRVLCTALNAESGPHFQILADAGHECVVVDRSLDLWNPTVLARAIQDYDAIIAGSEPYPPDVIASSPRLKVLARAGVGFDAINLPTCDERRVVVATTPGCNHHSVAEHAIAMLMAVGRGFPALDQEVRRGEWNRNPYPRVWGRTLGLVGLGRIGQATAIRARGLGMNVLAYDPVPQQSFAQQHGITLVPLDTLITQSDFISLHLPVTAETRHMINDHSISTMKPGVVIINTSRGPLIDEPALIRGLQSGKVRAAGLDVFAVEPLPTDSPLISMPNVFLSGHVAGLDNESHDATWEMAAHVILRLLRGEWPAECIQNLKGCSDWKW
jgi:D-3-phosphoglycerate dehydrogenase